MVPPWIVLVAGLVAGLPHGAVDHLVPRWWLGPRAPWMLVLVGGYAATAIASYLAFRAWPVAAVALFLAVSAWHFGSGETGFADLRAGRAVAGRRLRAAGHVLAVLALPVLLHPDGVLPLLRVMVDAPVDLPPGARTAAWVGVVVVAIVVATDLSRGRRAEAADLGLLALLAVLVHPLAAFGVYFGAWHSVRHLARTLVDDPGNARHLDDGRLGAALRRFAVSAALPTLASLSFVGVLVVVADGWQGFASEYLALLAGLTVPHLVTVAWADRRRDALGSRSGSRRAATTSPPVS